METQLSVFPFMDESEAKRPWAERLLALTPMLPIYRTWCQLWIRAKKICWLRENSKNVCLSFPSKQIFLQKYHNLATFIECLKITKNISGIVMLYTVRLIRSFSNTVNFVFATSMLYSVQCARTNMSYHHRNTTAFCSRRTTMVNWWHEFFGCCYCCHI